MAEFPALPLWTDAYLGDTTHLTTIEHGAYLLLLMAMWRSKGCCLPNDDKLLARYARLTSGQWRRLKDTLMPFFTIDGDVIRQGRLTDEANAVRQLSVKASDSANARWLKEKKRRHAVASSGQCDRNAPTPTPIKNNLPTSSGASSLRPANKPLPDPPEKRLDELLFGNVLSYLADRTGKKPNGIRSLIGAWKRDHGADAVLMAARSAYRQDATEPIAYIGATLKNGGISARERAAIDADADQRRRDFEILSKLGGDDGHRPRSNGQDHLALEAPDAVGGRQISGSGDGDVPDDDRRGDR